MGKSTKAFLILGALLVIVIGGRAIYSAMNPQSDTTLIKEALAESIKASREGRPGGVMDKLSDNITYNGTNEGGNSREIARYIKNSKPDVAVDNDEPEIHGNEATIVSPVTLTVSVMGQAMDRRIKDVTLTFKKEDDREWLIFPVKRWKLAEVEVPDSAVAGMIQQ